MKKQTPNKQSTARFSLQSRIIKSLAHPTRLFFVDQLSHGERCVCDLAEMVGIDMSTASKHLSLLKNAGIVEVDKRGLQVFYSLRATCSLKFLQCVESMIKSARSEVLTAG
jgi:DNA-binding transcriptional ArsR family regulator